MLSQLTCAQYVVKTCAFMYVYVAQTLVLPLHGDEYHYLTINNSILFVLYSLNQV